MIGILLVGHGSRLKDNAEVVHALGRMLEARERGPVTTAFMEQNTPTIPEGAATLVAKGVDEIFVLPCFLASGIHLTEDIPREMGMVERDGHVLISGKRVKVRFCGPLGADPRLVDVLEARLDEAGE